MLIFLKTGVIRVHGLIWGRRDCCRLFCYLNLQAELEGRHSQAGAWERENCAKLGLVI